jgi:hypothetical protein
MKMMNVSNFYIDTNSGTSSPFWTVILTDTSGVQTAEEKFEELKNKFFEERGLRTEFHTNADTIRKWHNQESIANLIDNEIL